MLTIVKPADATTVTATQAARYVTLAYGDSTLVLPILARPGNYTEVIYIQDGELQFWPGATPVMAATLAFSGSTATLTLCPLPVATVPSGLSPQPV